MPAQATSIQNNTRYCLHFVRHIVVRVDARSGAACLLKVLQKDVPFEIV